MTETSPASSPDNSSPPKKKMGNLASRFLVAVVAIPILLVAVYQPYHAITWALVFAVGLIGIDEFAAMITGKDKGNSRGSTVILAGALTAAFYWLPLHFHPMLVLSGLLVGSFLIPALFFLFRYDRIETVATRLLATTTGFVYVGAAMSFVAMLKRDFGGPSFETDIGAHLIILVLASAWLSDTGGYFAGKALGRHKLYPSVSPNKTWEGSIGGLVAAGIGAAAIKTWLLPSFGWADIMLLAIPAAAIGQIGDLCESLLKRSVGVKDSGALLPGHGGILDRVDAVLFIGPYVYLYVAFAM